MSEASAPAEIQGESYIAFVPRGVEKTVEEVKQSQDVITPNRRQQRKIIKYLTSVDPMPNFFRAYDIPLNEDDYDKFMIKQKEGKISDEKVNKMLSTIASPLDRKPADPDEIASMQHNLNNNSQGRAFIAHIIGKGMDQRDSLSQSDLILFYENNPLPSTLENVGMRKFLDELEKVNGVNGAQKKAEYEISITQMMRGVYGKRMEYWEQYKLLCNQQTKHDLKKIPAGVEVADYFEALKDANLKARGH